MQIAVNVFDFDRRVIDQNADRQRHAAQRHHVQRLAQERQDDDRHQNRQRDRDHDDQRASPGTQEQQDHQPRQPRGDRGFLDDAFNRCAHENRLIEHRRDVQVPAAAPPRCAGSAAFTLFTTSSVEALPLFRIESSTPGLPSTWTTFCLHLESIAHVRNIADVNRRAVHRLDRHVIERLGEFRAAVQADRIFLLADFRGARRKNQALRVDGGGDIRRRDAVGEQLLRIEIDHDLPLLAAIRIRNLHAGHRDQILAQRS